MKLQRRQSAELLSSMLNKRFENELLKGLPGSWYFLWSKEIFFLEEARAKVTGVVVSPDHMDFNYDVFYPSASSQEILDVAFTLPFLSPRRLVVIKDFHQFSKSQIKTLSPYFEKPNDTTCMLMLSQKEPKLDFISASCVYPLNVRESEIPAWLRQKAGIKGIKLSADAVDCLIESVGPDIGLLVMEIEKLALSGFETIEGKDVMACTGMIRGYTSFDLVDALISGQKTRVFRILKRLVEGRSSEVPAIVGALNWHYRQFYALWVNKGKRLPRMKNATYSALLKYIPLFTQENFFSVFQSLHEADLGIKTSGRPELALEILLIKLLQTEIRN